MIHSKISKDWKAPIYTDLIKAVRAGNLPEVEQLISTGSDVNLAESQYGYTALWEAACKESSDVVKALIAAKADVNLRDKFGSVPIHAAASCCNRKIITLLIEAGADVNLADNSGRTALIDVLYACASKEDINEIMNCPRVGIEEDDSVILAELVKTMCNGEIIDMLLKAGSNVNLECKNGDTPLLIALDKGHPQIVNELIKAGADVNFKNKYGITPIITALNKGNVEIINALRAAGARLNLKFGDVSKMIENLVSQNRNLLMMAAASGNLAEVKQLISAGEDVNSADIYGETALMMAAYSDHAEVVSTLIAAGADVNMKDKQGRTALMMAKKLNHAEIVKILKARKKKWFWLW